MVPRTRCLGPPSAPARALSASASRIRGAPGGPADANGTSASPPRSALPRIDDQRRAENFTVCAWEPARTDARSSGSQRARAVVTRWSRKVADGRGFADTTALDRSRIPYKHWASRIARTSSDGGYMTTDQKVGGSSPSERAESSQVTGARRASGPSCSCTMSANCQRGPETPRSLVFKQENRPERGDQFLHGTKLKRVDQPQQDAKAGGAACATPSTNSRRACGDVSRRRRRACGMPILH
jgi:hypothetical protein